MILYKDVKKTTTEKIPTKVICDICKEEYVANDWKNYPRDGFEIQEFHHIKFRGGYGSVFGDLYDVECDICQYCLHTMIKNKCRIEILDD